MDDFFAGPENQLAVPALEQLLQNSDQAPSSGAALFNPLVLIGPTGFGKTHLARGIIRHWAANAGDVATEYLTAIDFARQLRTMREEGTVDALRDRWAKLDLLVLEDLHNLPQSLFVQRELRDTLDRLLDSSAAVVITTQQPPAAIDGLDPGLRDRLTNGLTIRLQPPGVEARRALLQAAAASRGLSLPDDQLCRLAQSVDGSVPQVFRALAEWELLEKSNHAEDRPTVNGTRPPLHFRQIMAVVARYFSLTQSALRSSARRKSLVYARGVAIHLARSLTDLSYAQIGQHLGRRDHTTIMHASKSIRSRLVTDATTQQDIEELKRILTAI
ncbi:MAG: DnaA/Hda family protein [Planctomycetota bacterium]